MFEDYEALAEAREEKAARLAPLFSTGKDDWETPDELYTAQYAQHVFNLDAAANPSNRKCAYWYGPGSEWAEDALEVSWGAGSRKKRVWLNPPYSRGLQGAFVKKAYEEVMLEHVEKVVILLPARTDTIMFHTYIYNEKQRRPRPWVQDIHFLKGRLRFKGAPASAPFPSMVVWFEL